MTARRRPPADVPRRYLTGFTCIELVLVAGMVAASAVMLSVAAIRAGFGG